MRLNTVNIKGVYAMRIRKILLTAAVLIIVAVISAEAGVLVTPERHIVKLKPQESQTVEYEITNTGTEDLNIEIDPRDWTASGVDMKSWLSLKEDKLNIKAGGTGVLKATLTAPEGVDGEIIAMLFLCYKEDEGSMLNVRNGIPLYFISEGTQCYGAEIESINVRYNIDSVKNSVFIIVF
jgi:hypothetical protein